MRGWFKQQISEDGRVKLFDLYLGLDFRERDVGEVQVEVVQGEREEHGVEHEKGLHQRAGVHHLNPIWFGKVETHRNKQELARMSGVGKLKK